MQKRRRRRVPRQKAARDDAGTEKEEFVVEIKVWLVLFDHSDKRQRQRSKTMTKTKTSKAI